MNSKLILKLTILFILIHVFVDLSMIIYVVIWKINNISDINFLNPRYLSVYNMPATDLGLIGLCLLLWQWIRDNLTALSKTIFFLIITFTGVWCIFGLLHLLFHMNMMYYHGAPPALIPLLRFFELLAALILSIMIIIMTIKILRKKVLPSLAFLRFTGIITMLYAIFTAIIEFRFLGFNYYHPDPLNIIVRAHNWFFVLMLVLIMISFFVIAKDESTNHKTL